jgi:hypothetical protein
MDSFASLQSLSTVPMLEIDGGNWPIFRRKFETYMDSTGLDEHFAKENAPAKTYEEVEAKPTKKTGESTEDLAKRVDVWNDGEVKWKEEARAWKKSDAKAKGALGKVVPNSIYMEISEFKHFHEMWNAVETRVERITLHQKSNLKGRLNQMYCDDKGNVLTHLQDMESIYQQLASRNAKISDEDYVDAIIRSLPQSYSNLMTSLLTIYSQMNIPVTPATIKDAIRKEHEARQTAALSRNRRPNEVALHAETRGRFPGRSRGRGRGGSRGRGGGGNYQGGGSRGGDAQDQSRFTCFNCGGKGHKAAACPSAKKPRGEGRDDRRNGGERSRETAAVADDESEEAWMAMVLGTDAIIETQPDISAYPGEISVPDTSETTPVQAFAIPTGEQRTSNSLSVEIYDSGCSRHMTPDRHRLINYRAISPKPISAANQESFSAIGAGDMYIQAPNGATSTRIKLRNVLYAPSMGCTLISISQIDQAGYSVAFQDGKCIIRNQRTASLLRFPSLEVSIESNRILSTL